MLQPPDYVRSLSPYQPGKSIESLERELGFSRPTEWLKLASNECPLPVPESVRNAILMKIDTLHIYPDPNGSNLRSLLSQVWHVGLRELSFGNGSNELIDLLIRTMSREGDTILGFEKSFIAYKICALAAGRKFLEAPLAVENKADSFELRFDLEAALAIVDEHRPSLFFLPNPNNPTGGYLPKEQLSYLLREMAARTQTLLVLDEAYSEFIDCETPLTLAEMRALCPRLVVIKTFSKVYGLAGLRIGAVVGPEDLIGYLDRVRNPFNVNSLAFAAAEAVLKDVNHLEKIAQTVCQGRAALLSGLKSLGLRSHPSQANFVLFETDLESSHYEPRLLSKGLILRPLLPYGLTRHFRVTVGTPAQNEKALSILSEVLS